MVKLKIAQHVPIEYCGRGDYKSEKHFLTKWHKVNCKLMKYKKAINQNFTVKNSSKFNFRIN